MKLTAASTMKIVTTLLIALSVSIGANADILCQRVLIKAGNYTTIKVSTSNKCPAGFKKVTTLLTQANIKSTVTQQVSSLATGPQGPTGPQGITGPQGVPFEVPEIVTFVGVWNEATTYNQYDLVSSATADVYFFSEVGSNLAQLPESNPGAWTMVKVNQLNTIRKTNVTLSSPGFTSLFSFKGLQSTKLTAGARVQYTIRATDAGSQIATESGIIQSLATPNSITCTVQTTDKLHLGTVNSGCTPGFFNPNSQPGVSIFDNVTFSSPAPITTHEVYFHITNTSALNDAATPPVPVQIRLE